MSVFVKSLLLLFLVGFPAMCMAVLGADCLGHSITGNVADPIGATIISLLIMVAGCMIFILSYDWVLNIRANDPRLTRINKE